LLSKLKLWSNCSVWAAARVPVIRVATTNVANTTVNPMEGFLPGMSDPPEVAS
jgi:hypothetical protein